MDGITLVRLALAVITDRLLIILALTLSFSLSCWAMYDPRYERLGVMAFFCFFSYLVVNTKERVKNEFKTESTNE